MGKNHSIIWHKSLRTNSSLTNDILHFLSVNIDMLHFLSMMIDMLHFLSMMTAPSLSLMCTRPEGNLVSWRPVT